MTSGTLCRRLDPWRPRVHLERTIVGHFDALGTQVFLDQTGTVVSQSVVGICWDEVFGQLLVTGHRRDAAPFSTNFSIYIRAYTFSGALIDQLNIADGLLGLSAAVIATGFGGAYVAGHTSTEYGGANQARLDQFVTRVESTVGTRTCFPGVPNSTGIASVMAGESWHFQAWHCDFATVATSNFTHSVVVEV